MREKTAEFIKNVDGFIGEARLYRVTPPVEYDQPYDDEDPPAKKTNYVVVSSVNALLTGPETYIFPANEDGEVASWGELDGSQRGTLDHVSVLTDAGYTAA